MADRRRIGCSLALGLLLACQLPAGAVLAEDMMGGDTWGSEEDEPGPGLPGAAQKKDSPLWGDGQRKEEGLRRERQYWWKENKQHQWKEQQQHWWRRPRETEK